MGSTRLSVAPAGAPKSEGAWNLAVDLGMLVAFLTLHYITLHYFLARPSPRADGHTCLIPILYISFITYLPIYLSIHSAPVHPINRNVVGQNVRLGFFLFPAFQMIYQICKVSASSAQPTYGLDGFSLSHIPPPSVKTFNIHKRYREDVCVCLEIIYKLYYCFYM